MSNKIPLTLNNGQVEQLQQGDTILTAYLANSTNKNLVTDAQLTIIGNTSGTNSGNETTTTTGALISGATEKTTPVDADMVGLMDSAASNVLKKLSWSNIKATLKTYFDTLYKPTFTNNTAFNQNFETSTTNIKMNGSVSVGSSSNIPRADHVHATDTTRANTDLSNLSTAGKVIASSYPMPSNTSTSVTLGASGSTYTATVDGFLTINKNGPTAFQYIYLVGSTGVISQSFAPVNGADVTAWIPMKKNDVCTYYYTTTGVTHSFAFVTAQGEA